MPQIKKLINAVQLYPNICNINTYKYEKYARSWERVAMRCETNDGGISGLDAYYMWSNLLKNYVEFLRNGGEFKYSKEMRFMQAHLIDASSDSSEIDEAVLLDAINHTDDDECEPEIEPKAAKKPRYQVEQATNNKKPQAKAIAPQTVKEDAKTVKLPTQAVGQEHNASVVTEVRESQAPPQQQQQPSPPLNTVMPNVAGLSSLQLIFLGYAKILQDLPLAIQLRTKHKIAQIMNEAELSLIETNDSDGVKK